MINILITTNNIVLLKKVVNRIYANNNLKIATNIGETIQILENRNIDIIFLDVKLLNEDSYKLFQNLDVNKRKKYKNSIVLISDIHKISTKGSDSAKLIEYPLLYLNQNHVIYKLNKLIKSKDVERKRKKIVQELDYIQYNLDYKGTNYLIDTILYMHINKNLVLDNLQKDVYPIVANKYNKTVNTVKCNIRYATDSMYCECDSNRIKEYFGFIEEKKPTVKEVIYRILDKII